MSYLLDTNVVSELRKSPVRAHPNVLRWAERRPINDLYLSAVTVYEVQLGIELKTRKDPEQGQILARWFRERLLPTFEGRILPFDERVALEAARLHVPDPKPLADSFIAATARVHGLVIATGNESDFANLRTPFVNPWSP